MGQKNAMTEHFSCAIDFQFPLPQAAFSAFFSSEDIREVEQGAPARKGGGNENGLSWHFLRGGFAPSPCTLC